LARDNPFLTCECPAAVQWNEAANKKQEQYRYDNKPDYVAAPAVIDDKHFTAGEKKSSNAYAHRNDVDRKGFGNPEYGRSQNHKHET